jgi:hypothetical protein
MSKLTALQKFVSELESGKVSLSEVTETSLVELPLTNRERAIILSGQMGLIRSVAAGQECINEVKLELTPESQEKLTG